MLGKLFKYEFKSTSRWMLPCYVFVLLATFVNMFTVNASRNYDYNALSGLSGTIINTIRVLLALTYGVAIIAMGVLTIFMIVSRFYKNLLSNEGYISLTLPVSVDEHLAAKVLTAMVWLFATAVIGVLSIFILMAREIELFEIFKELPKVYAYINMEMNGMLGVYIFEFVVFGIVVMAEGLLQMYFAMALGQLSNNHKIGMAILSYIGINFILQVIATTFAVNTIVTLSVGAMDIQRFWISLSQQGFVAIIWEILIGAAFYFGTRYILTKRVNLQ